MNTKICVETLSALGDIPNDSEVVSTNNKVVVISQRERVVARIGSIANLKVRDDPHDLRYSHRAAWLAGDTAPVVKPLQESPTISGDYVISSYPLLKSGVTLDQSRAKDIYSMAHSLSNALSVVEPGMTLRRLDVSAYVEERLRHMLDTPGYNQELVEYVSAQTERMNVLYPFSELTDADRSLVHGDFKADNVVANGKGDLKAIDLDAVAIGPRLYDLSSWRLRTELGDNAPVEEVVSVGRRTETWNEESYRALIGWKAISSMSFTLRYESPELNEVKIADIAHAGIALGGLSNVPARVTDI